MSKIEERFIVNLQGKQFVTYEGLLDLAHQEGLIGIETELIQIPTKDNDYLAIVQAIATTKDKKFMGIGDCDNSSANRMIAPHKIRMAETRAKARALRDLTNVGMTAIEELSGDIEESKAPKQANTQVKGKLSDKQIARLYAISNAAGISAEQVKEKIKSQLNKEVSEMTKDEYDKVCTYYEGLKK